jgi:hypothetical protein
MPGTVAQPRYVVPHEVHLTDSRIASRYTRSPRKSVQSIITRGGIMKNITLAFGLACVSAAAIAAPPLTEPVDVTVANPVLPVEVQNADPIPVAIAGGSGETLYGHTIGTTCPFLNQCTATFPAVPAGKRLEVKFIAAWVRTNDAAATGLGSLHANDATGATVRLLFPIGAFSGAYYGSSFVFNEQVHVVFEAGEAPVLELGTTVNLIDSEFNKMTVTGVLVDAAP